MTTALRGSRPSKSEQVVQPPASMDRALSAMVTVAAQVRPEHIAKLLNIAETIVQGQLAVAAIDAATAQRLRLLRAKLDNDMNRADRAAEVLREYRAVMSEEQQADMAMLIIRVTLGHEPGP